MIWVTLMVKSTQLLGYLWNNLYYLFFLIVIFRGRICIIVSIQMSIFRKHYSFCRIQIISLYNKELIEHAFFISSFKRCWTISQSESMNILFQFANTFDMNFFNFVYNITCVLSTCMCLCSVQCSVEAVMIFKIKWKYR